MAISKSSTGKATTLLNRDGEAYGQVTRQIPDIVRSVFHPGSCFQKQQEPWSLNLHHPPSGESFFPVSVIFTGT